MQRGFTLRPGSRFEAICSDVVPIAALIKQEQHLRKMSTLSDQIAKRAEEQAKAKKKSLLRKETRTVSS